MMENKNEPHADGKPVDYGPRAERCAVACMQRTTAHALASPTEHVDNFVQKPAGNACGPSLVRHPLGVMRKTAVKKLMKSMTCCVNAGDRRGRLLLGRISVALWSSRATIARATRRTYRSWAGAAAAARCLPVMWHGKEAVVCEGPMAIGPKLVRLRGALP
jgi:hypothetical protein